MDGGGCFIRRRRRAWHGCRAGLGDCSSLCPASIHHGSFIMDHSYRMTMSSPAATGVVKPAGSPFTKKVIRRPECSPSSAADRM